MECHGAIDEANDAESALVNGSMVTPAQEEKVVESGRPALGPVLDVMRVAPAGRAA